MADCPHCDPEHGSPHRCHWGVRIAPEVDGDGQPTHLIVQPTNGAHVAQGDADWLWQLIRDGECVHREPLPAPEPASEHEHARRLVAIALTAPGYYAGPQQADEDEHARQARAVLAILTGAGFAVVYLPGPLTPFTDQPEWKIHGPSADYGSHRIQSRPGDADHAAWCRRMGAAYLAAADWSADGTAAVAEQPAGVPGE